MRGRGGDHRALVGQWLDAKLFQHRRPERAFDEARGASFAPTHFQPERSSLHGQFLNSSLHSH